MKRKALIVLGSTVSALFAMGTGVTSYQQTQKERREALQATVVAMQFLDGALDRVKTTLEQSTSLREELIRKTDDLLGSTVTSEQELIDNGTRVADLTRRRAELSTEATRVLIEVRRALTDANDAAGHCRQIVSGDKLKESQSALVESQLRERTLRIKEAKTSVERFEQLVSRCELLDNGLQLYAEQNRTALGRMEAIRREAEEALSVQRARQAAAQEVNDRLAKLQTELQRDLETLKPKE